MNFKKIWLVITVILILVIFLLRIILIISVKVISKSDDINVIIPVNFSALILSFIIINKIIERIIVIEDSKYILNCFLLSGILQYYKHSPIYHFDK